MPRKTARSASASVRVARGAGSRPQLASVLQEGRNSANIYVSFGSHLENFGLYADGGKQLPRGEHR